MYDINILFDDYHKFNKNVKNHINVTKDTIIDWDDFCNVVRKITNDGDSIVNVHVYDGVLLSKKLLEMFNDCGVEVTLAFNDTIGDDFLINYYFKYIIVDRLSLILSITGNQNVEVLFYLIHKLWSSYKIFHIHDANIIFQFEKNLPNNIITFISENLKRQCDNRRIPIPSSFFEYMLRDMLREKEQPFIPYDTFISIGDKIAINKNKFNIDYEFSIDSDELFNENVKDKFINVLNLLYSAVVETFRCKNCPGYNICPKLQTIFYSSSSENCTKEFSNAWTEFLQYVQYYDDQPSYSINDIKGNSGLV